MVDKVRNAALNGLLLIFSGDAYSNKYIDSVCKKQVLSDKERAFFTRLFLGTVEKAILLDAYIEEASNVPIKKIRPIVLQILRMSIYQLLFMDSVPDSAAISTAISLCEERRFAGLKGYVNGVLGNISRNKDEITKKLYREVSFEKKLSLNYSVPRWLIDYWQGFLEDETIKEILYSFSKAKGITLLVNTDKTTMDRAKESLEKKGISFTLVEELDAIYVNKSTGAEDIPGFLEGHYYVMDTASIRAIKALDIQRGDNILDVCSAPGGKGLMAARLSKTGTAHLRDIYDQKVEIIKENAARLGINNVKIKRQNALDFDKTMVGQMDICICDLPCSGLGSIGTKPEIRYRMDMGKIKSLAKLQGDILEISKKYVKTGGKLLFSTCTISSLENEDNLEAFLRQNRDFELIEKQSLYPGKTDTDGFFYGVLKKIR